MREIEVKAKVKDFDAIERKLEEKGCVLSEPISQHDVIYSLKGSKNEFESASEGDVIMRIRKMKDKVELNLKQQRTSEGDNLEYETVVSDAEATHNILATLGWYPVIEVKKVRRKGRLGVFEVCLDQVEGLGAYIELEKLVNDDADPEEVRSEIFAELESFGISKSDENVKGYDTQLYDLGLNKIY